MTSISANRILLAPFRWLRGSLFLETYRRSDAAFWEERRLAGSWRPLGAWLTYRSTLIGMRSDTGLVLLFTLRAAQGCQIDLARLELSIKQKGVVRRQMLVVRDLDDQATTVSLQKPTFDTRQFQALEKASMGQVLIKLLELRDSDGKDVLGRKKVTLFKPTVELYNGQEFKRLRGRYWNVELIRAEKHGLRNRWYRKLVKPAGQLWRPLTMRRALYRLVTNEWTLSSQYWLQTLTARQPVRAQPREAVD